MKVALVYLIMTLNKCLLTGAQDSSENFQRCIDGTIIQIELRCIIFGLCSLQNIVEEIANFIDICKLCNTIMWERLLGKLLWCNLFHNAQN